MRKKKLLHDYNFPRRALRNLGTFNTNYMDPDACDVFLHYAGVNAVDNHAYPELESIKAECAEFILNFLNAESMSDYHYVTTSGSSESILLAMLIFKNKSRSLNSQAVFKPNIIIGENSHISWHKAARYLEIELRIAPLNSDSFILDNVQVMTLLDDHTIGICCTLGAPTTLLCDDVFDLNHRLHQHHQTTGQFISIHVDAASGGFVFPFVSPKLTFDFRLPHVFSINMSSHKYGLVYPSLGWLFMRKTSCLEELLDESAYLGTSIKQFSVQFSHSASHLMTQYYYIQTLGFSGYQERIMKLYTYNDLLKQQLTQSLNNPQFIGRGETNLPGLVFSVRSEDMDALSAQLKEKNWYLPVYSLPSSALRVARIVIRYGYDESLINDLSADMAWATTSKIGIE